MPANLTNMDPEEYAEALRAAHWGQKAIDKELEALARFKGFIKPDTKVPGVSLDTDPNNQYEQALTRRRHRKAAKAEEEEVE